MHEKKIVLNKIPQNTVTRNYAKEKQLKNLHATLYLWDEKSIWNFNSHLMINFVIQI